MSVYDQLQLVSLISFRNKTVLTMNYLFYIGYAHRRIVWKYISALHVLNKNENIINTGYWLCENRTEKLIPIENNQAVLIAKISSRKTQKNGQSAKISCHTVARNAFCKESVLLFSWGERDVLPESSKTVWISNCYFSNFWMRLKLIRWMKPKAYVDSTLRANSSYHMKAKSIIVLSFIQNV